MATLAITGGSVREGAAGQTSTLTFTLMRDGDLAPPLSVAWTALAGLPDLRMQQIYYDLLAPPGAAVPAFAEGLIPSGTATFTAGAATAEVALTVLGNDILSEDRKVFLLAAAEGIAEVRGEGAILTDETWFEVSATGTLDEGATGGVYEAYSVLRRGRTDMPVTVDFTALGVGPDPVDGADMVGGVLPAGTLSFAAGQTRAMLPVVVRPDAAVEPNETLRIVLSNPTGGAVLGATSWRDAVVLNDDMPPGDVPEGPQTQASIAPGGRVDGAIDMRLDRDWFRADLAAGQPYRIRVHGMGLATPAATLRRADGSTLTAPVLWPPDLPDTQVTVTPDSDGPWFIEVASQSYVSNGGGPVLAAWNIGAYRLELDTVSAIAIAADAPARAEGAEGETTSFIFTITRSQGLLGPLNLPWRVEAAGPHVADVMDFAGGAFPAGVVAFAPGQAQAVVTVTTLGNDLAQGHRSLRLVAGTVDDPIVAPAVATVTLWEDEAAPGGVMVVGDAGNAEPAWFGGPVPGVAREWVALSAESLQVAADGPGWFLRTGDGNDTIAATGGGTNVLDGGGGSNFLVGGDGVDHFFVDLRAPASAPSWTTIANAAPGDTVTIWGIASALAVWDAMREDGAPGWRGHTVHATSPGGQPAAVTLAGVGVWGGYDWSLETLPDSITPGLLLRIA